MFWIRGQLHFISSLHIFHFIDGVDQLIRLLIRTIFLRSCFHPSTDIYIQPRVLAIALENIFFWLVECRCLWFLRARVLILIFLSISSHAFDSRPPAAFVLYRISIFSRDPPLDFRWKKNMVGWFRTHALRVNTRLSTPKTTMSWDIEVNLNWKPRTPIYTRSGKNS